MDHRRMTVRRGAAPGARRTAACGRRAVQGSLRGRVASCGMAERLAIVGGDAAGMSGAGAARRREPTLDVVAFERGPYASFSACGIPFYLGGLFEDSDRLVTRSPDEHRERGIEGHMRSTGPAIDLDPRVLTLRAPSGDERTEGFDQVVLAPGAEAVAPDVPGADATEPARTID